MNYFRFWIGDYLKDTASLSVCEHGAYTLLLLEYYNNGPLPVELPKLYRICRANNQDEQEAVSSIAGQFFKVNGDGLRHNKRADEERDIALRVIGLQREAGKEAATKRWGEHGSTHRSTLGLSGTGGDTSSNLQPLTSNLQPSAFNKKASADAGAKAPRSPKDFIFLEALEALKAQGVEEPQARSLLGRLVKHRGEEQAAADMRHAIATGVLGLRDWVGAILKGPTRRQAADGDLGRFDYEAGLPQREIA